MRHQYDIDELIAGIPLTTKLYLENFDEQA